MPAGITGGNGEALPGQGGETAPAGSDSQQQMADSQEEGGGRVVGVGMVGITSIGQAAVKNWLLWTVGALMTISQASAGCWWRFRGPTA